MRRLFVCRLLLAAGLLALAASGCHERGDAPTAGPTQAGGGGIETPVAQPQVEVAVQPATFPPPPPDQADGVPGAVEIWDSYSMRAGEQLVRVGYSRTTIMKTAGQAGQEPSRTCNFTRTLIERAGQSVQQDLQVVSLDTPDGRLVAFETRMGEIVTTGVVRGNQLELTTTSAGRTERQTIPWQAEWGGPFAAEQSARRQPLAPGEKRTVRGLTPLDNTVSDTLLEAADYETVDLPTGPRKLLKVRAVMQFGGRPIESTQWADERGETLKAVIPAMGQESVRTAKEDALQRTPGGRLDLLVNSTVLLPGGFPNAQQSKKAVYLATVKTGKIDGVFPNSAIQQVTIKDERTAEVRVIAVRPTAAGAREPATLPGSDYLAPSSYIQSDDPAIIDLANSVARGESDPWTVACALEKHVDASIKLKSFAQAFATAAEVARTREGDCTEHAMLLAALCRARKIPARCAFGLIYFEPLKGFAFHMWTEVWIAGGWIPMDATLGQGGIAADHLKLGDTSLAGQGGLAPLIAVTNAFGRLELQLMSAE